MNLTAMLAAGGAILAAFVGLWTYDHVTMSAQRGEIASLQKQIDDPITGWRRQLSVCQGNEQVFRNAVAPINQKIEDLGKKADAIAAAQGQVGKTATSEGQKTRDIVMNILKMPVPGVTACDRALVIQREPLQ